MCNQCYLGLNMVLTEYQRIRFSKLEGARHRRSRPDIGDWVRRGNEADY